MHLGKEQRDVSSIRWVRTDSLKESRCHHPRHATPRQRILMNPGSDRDLWENRYSFKLEIKGGERRSPAQPQLYLTPEKQPKPTVSLPSMWARRIQPMTPGNLSYAAEARLSFASMPKIRTASCKTTQKANNIGYLSTLPTGKYSFNYPHRHNN